MTRKSDEPQGPQQGRQHGGQHGDDGGDDVLDALVADELTRRGELLPTTAGEVRAAERRRVAFEGELPGSLRTLRGEGAATAPSAASARVVVAIDEIRRRRAAKRTAWMTHAGTFTLGAAAAALLLVSTREPRVPRPRQDPAGVPTASGSAVVPAPPAAPPAIIPAVTSCATECCAGARCAAAKGELRACASGRTCVACAEGTAAGGAYAVRLGNLAPTAKIAPDALRGLDICARIGGSPWSCEPAWADAASRPVGRVLPGVTSAADLATGLELELRPRGTVQVLGRWRDAVRLGPTVLCRGAGALLANEGVDLGSLAIDLMDAHWVEIARDRSTGPLKELRASLEFADVVPSLVQTGAAGSGGAGFVLAAGPHDQATAERLRWELLHLGREARVTLGADFTGPPQPLPARR